MDWDIEVKLSEMESMITVYQKRIEVLEKENKSLKAQVLFLTQQLEYKTFGKPNNEEDL